MLKRNAILAIVAWVSLAGCSHVPRKPADPALAEQLSVRLQEALAEGLRERKDLRRIRKIEIFDVESETSDRYKLGYRISFDSDSQPFGEVSHDAEGVATLVRKTETEWKAEFLEKRSQSLIFHQPASVVTEKKADVVPSPSHH
jgi:hypothetical protein